MSPRSVLPVVVLTVALAVPGAAGAAILGPGENALVSIPDGFGGAPAPSVGTSRTGATAASDDGCRIAFNSQADDLSTGDDDSVTNIYVRDRCQAVPTTTLVSRGTGAAGVGANGDSISPSISADGTVVAFSSAATNLAGASENPVADANGVDDDVFVRDLTTNRTYLATRQTGLAGAMATSVDATSPVVTVAGGKILVVFDAFTDALAAGDTNGRRDAFLRNVTDGITSLVSAKNATAATESTTGFATNPAISEDGAWVAFSSNATDLNALDTTGSRDIYVRNVAGTNQTLLASRTAANAPSNGDAGRPAINANGTVVAFTSNATNLQPLVDADTGSDIYASVRAADFGAAQLISRATGAAGTRADDESFGPAIDDAGLRIAFQTRAGNLAAGDANADIDIYMRNRADDSTTLLSRTAAGDTTLLGTYADAALSGDGLRVAFAALGADAYTPDADGDGPVVLTRTIGPPLGTSELVSRPAGSGPFKGLAGENSVAGPLPVVSPDGRFVAFTSAADALPTFGSSTAQHVYLRDMLLGTTTLVSRADGADGAAAGAASFAAATAVSADGRKVAFVSSAANLVSGDTNGKLDAFVRDLGAGHTTRLGRPAAGSPPGFVEIAQGAPVLSADGTLAAYATDASLSAADAGTTTDVYVESLVTGAQTLVSRAAGPGAQGDQPSYSPSLSADGSRVAFVSTAANLVTGDANGTSDVFVRDLSSGSVTLASRSDGAAGALGTADSRQPSLNADGSRVAFQSYSDLTGPTASSGNIFVRDLTAGTTVLASRADGPAGASGDQGSADPSLSADGTRVLFGSAATNFPGATAPASLYRVFLRDLTAGTTELVSRGPGVTGTPAVASAGGGAVSGGGTCAVFATSAPEIVAGVTHSDGRLVYERGLRGECPAVAPDTSITSGPTGLTRDRSPAFGFASDEAGATFACVMDGGAAQSCTPGFKPAVLSDGAHALRVTARDPAGNADLTPAERAFTVDGTAPVITRVAAKPSKFRVVAAKRRARRSAATGGTKLGFRLSEPAAVAVAVAVELPGRRSGKRCVAPRKGRPVPRRSRCVRLQTVTTLRSSLAAGTHSVSVTGRFGKKVLKPGKHRLTITATDAAGNSSAARSVRVTVLKPR